MTCENCGSEHNGSYGSGRFCSLKCARGFSTKNKRTEINKKISASLINKINSGETIGFCKKNFNIQLAECMCECGKKFIAYKRDGKKNYCSKSCAMKYRDFEIRSKAASKTQKTLLSQNRHNGFPSRKGKKPSWAEQYFIDRFNENNIIFEREFKINRFFADFAFIKNKIVLEIDGKQHEYPERILHDIKRDTIIKNEGWKIYRIKWIKAGDESMYSKFLDFINELKTS